VRTTNATASVQFTAQMTTLIFVYYSMDDHDAEKRTQQIYLYAAEVTNNKRCQSVCSLHVKSYGWMDLREIFIKGKS